jgi:hypothetical protein
MGLALTLEKLSPITLQKQPKIDAPDKHFSRLMELFKQHQRLGLKTHAHCFPPPPEPKLKVIRWDWETRPARILSSTLVQGEGVLRKIK